MRVYDISTLVLLQEITIHEQGQDVAHSQNIHKTRLMGIIVAGPLQVAPFSVQITNALSSVAPKVNAMRYRSTQYDISGSQKPGLLRCTFRMAFLMIDVLTSIVQTSWKPSNSSPGGGRDRS
jgi:hypothetical protein